MNVTNNSLTSLSLSTSEYTNIGLGFVLLISEILPFIKNKGGNGIIDSCICLLSGSSCVINKLKEQLEKKQESEEKEIELPNITNKV